MYKQIFLALLTTILTLDLHAANNKPLRVAYFENYAPYSWLDSDGQMRGIFIDILDEVIGKRMGVTVKHIGLPWARAQQHVRMGDYDAMIAPITAERATYTHISDVPVLTSRLALFTDAEHSELNRMKQAQSLADIESYEFITQLGDGWAAEKLSGMKVYYVSDLNSVLRMLSAGYADLFIESSMVVHWNLRSLNMVKNIIEVEGISFEETPYHLMLSKKSRQQIGEEFDKQMAAFVQSGQLNPLLQDYR